MKLFKKLATICTALILSLGLGAAFAACDGNEGGNSLPQNSSQADTSVKYNFYVVKADGTPAVGYGIQLCKRKANGELGSCLNAVGVGADGTAKVSIDDTTLIYVIHVGTMTDNDFTTFEALDENAFSVQGIHEIPANYDGGAITVMIH